MTPAPAGKLGSGERRQTLPGLTPIPVDAGRASALPVKGGKDCSPCLTQQPAAPPLNTPQNVKPVFVQVEADPPMTSAPTVDHRGGMNDQLQWGAMEASKALADDEAFPTLGQAPKLKHARAKARKAAATAEANSAIPGYVAPVAPDPNNATIPLTSCIAPTWVRTTMASMVQKQQVNQGFHTEKSTEPLGVWQS